MSSQPVPIETLLAHRAWVRDLARGLVHDENRANDLEQQTWLAALEHPPRHGDSPRGWLATVLRRASGKDRRSDYRRDVRERAVARPEALPAVDDLAAHSEILERLVRAVLDLEEPYRSAVLLRYFEGLEPGEIARRTGTPVETIRSRLRRALERLRERFDAEHGGERRAWVALLLPVAAPRSGRDVPISGGVASALSSGALLMSTKVVAAAIAVVLVAVVGYVAWNGVAEEGGSAGVGGKQVAQVPPPAKPVAPAPRPREVAPSAVAPEPARGPHATGKVFDQAGKPVSGAEVISVPDDPAVSLEVGGRENPAIGRATTGSDGAFLVPLKGDRLLNLLFVSAPGFGPGLVEGVRPGDARDIVLEPETRLPGRVVDGSGKPVAGAHILVVLTLPLSVVQEWTLQSDRDGRFEIRGVGGVRRRAGREGSLGLLVTAPGFAPFEGGMGFAPASFREGPLEVVLLPGEVLRVKVVDAETGNPLPGALVAYGAQGTPTPVMRENWIMGKRASHLGTYGETRTTERGFAEFPNAPVGLVQSLFLRAWKEGWTAEACAFNASLGGPAEVRLALRPATVARGRVVDEAGTPVPGATVNTVPAPPDLFPCAFGDRPLGGFVKTDASGRYEIRALPAGRQAPFEVELQATQPGGGDSGSRYWGRNWGLKKSAQPPGVKVRAEAGVPVEVPDIVVPAPQEAPGVRFLVVDAEGSPVPGAVLQAPGEMAHGTATGIDGVAVLRWGPDPSVLGPTGDLTAIPVRVTRSGFATARVVVKPRAGDLPEVRVVLGRGLRSAGRVDRGGRPAHLVHVVAWRGSQRSPEYSQTVAVDPDGRFAIEDSPAGTLTIWAGANPRWSGEPVESPRVEIEAGKEDVVLVLPPDEVARGGIEGRVLDARTGRPVPGFSVEIRTPEDGKPRGGSDSLRAGRFVVDGVPEGRWKARVSAPGYPDEEQEAEVRAGAVATVEFRLARGCVVRGSVRDPDGQPVPKGRRLSLVSTDGKRGGWCWVGPDGTIECPGVRPGVYGIEVPGEPPHFEQAVLVSSPTHPVRIGEGDETLKVDADLIRAGTLRVGTGTCPELPEGIRDEETALQVTGKGVRVEVKDAAGSVFRDVVVLQGTESVHFLPPGRFVLKVTPKDGNPSEETVEVRASEVVKAGIGQK